MWAWVPSHRVLTILQPSIHVKALPSPTLGNEPASHSTELCLGRCYLSLIQSNCSILGAVRHHLVLNINEFGRAQISSTRDACALLITHARAAGCIERERVWGTWHSQCFHQCSSNSWWTLGYTLHCSTTFLYLVFFFYGQKDF